VTNLDDALQKLLKYAMQVYPSINDYMQPGLDSEFIQNYGSYSLPPEVVTLYQWHNGTVDDGRGKDKPFLFYYHRFLPLEESYEIYQELMQINIEIGGEGYSPQLFPLFTFWGEYYSIWIEENSSEYGSIYFVHQGEAKVYDSLVLMVYSILESYETGAYTIHNNEITPDEQRVASIKAKWNPCRHLPDGSIIEFHP